MPNVQITISAKAQNLAEFEAVNAKLASMDAQVSGLNATLNQSTGQLKIHGTAQAANAAEAQNLAARLEGTGIQVTGLKTKAAEAVTVERDLAREGNSAARAMGSLGAKGGEVTERFTALSGVMGAGGPMGLAIGGLIVGLGALVEGGKKVEETYREQQTSALSLKQASDATGRSYEGLSRSFEEFAAKNAAFISNENDARDALAGFVRAGFDEADSMKALGNAVNLAAIKHEDLKTAGMQTLLMMEGSGRTAKQLGLDIKALTGSAENEGTALKNVTKATTEVATAQDRYAKAQEALKLEEDSLSGKRKQSQRDLDVLADKHAQVKMASDNLTKAQQNQKAAIDSSNNSMKTAQQVSDQLSIRLDKGSQTADSNTQAHNRLGHAWDQLAHNAGPGLNTALTQATNKLADLLGWVDANWGAFQRLGSIVLQTAAIISGTLPNISAGATFATANTPSARAGGQRRQHGGPVLAGEGYWVGEAGPEWFSPRTSGTIIPTGAGGPGAMNNTFNIYGVTDPQGVALAVDARLSRLVGGA